MVIPSTSTKLLNFNQISVLRTSVTDILWPSNFGHIITTITEVKSLDEILLVTLSAEIMTSLPFFLSQLFSGDLKLPILLTSAKVESC